MMNTPNYNPLDALVEELRGRVNQVQRGGYDRIEVVLSESQLLQTTRTTIEHVINTRSAALEMMTQRLEERLQGFENKIIHDQETLNQELEKTLASEQKETKTQQERLTNDIQNFLQQQESNLREHIGVMKQTYLQLSDELQRMNQTWADAIDRQRSDLESLIQQIENDQMDSDKKLRNLREDLEARFSCIRVLLGKIRHAIFFWRPFFHKEEELCSLSRISEPEQRTAPISPSAKMEDATETGSRSSATVPEDPERPKDLGASHAPKQDVRPVSSNLLSRKQRKKKRDR